MSELDKPLYWWTERDPYTRRQACRNLLVIGATGSGKSKGSGDHLIRALARDRNTGGLWLAASHDDLAYARRVFREERTPDDLLVMEPGGLRCNVLDYMRQHGADTRAITQYLMTAGETLERAENGDGGQREPLWTQANRIMIHNSVEIYKGAMGKVDPWGLQQLITGAAKSLAETGDEKWRKSFHFEKLQAAQANAEARGDTHDFNLAADYFMNQLPAMNDRTRTSIEAGVLGLLHVMNTGDARRMLATETDITPDLFEERKWWFVNMPITPGDATAVFANMAVKYLAEWYVLRRQATEASPLIPIVCDEFPKMANGGDAGFVAECRKHLGFLVAMTQSVHALHERMGGKGDHRAKSLLTNFHTIIWHTLGDAESAEHASGLVGKYRERFIGTSSSEDSLWDVVRGAARINVQVSEQWQPRLQPAVFLSGLRCGGPPHNTVDGIVMRTGEPFSNGKNFLKVSFGQYPRE